MSEPVCPSCDVKGIEHFVSTASVEHARNRQPWFYVVHCDHCGYVYNVINKHSPAEAKTARFVLPSTSD